MLKINHGYQSPFEYIADYNYLSANRLSKAISSRENFFYEYCTFFSKPDKRQIRGDGLSKRIMLQCLGSLQPVADMYQDAVDTFKPYKGPEDVKKDVLQPVAGLLHIARGIVNLPIAILVSVYNILIRNVRLAYSLKKYCLLLATEFIRLFSWVVDSCLSMVRGTTQIATTPLTWLFKIPARTAITVRTVLHNGMCQG